MVSAAPMNLRLTRHADIMGRHGDDERWAEVLLEDGRNRSVWISGPPGTPPDPHIHPDFNEFWIALDGRTQWQIGQYEPVLSEWGDIIMAPAGFAHDIQPKEGVQAIRFGITHPDSNHDIKGVAPCRLIPVDEGQTNPNLIHTKLKSLVERNGTSSNWVEVAVNDNRNYATYTHELSGTSSDSTSHSAENRWWVVLQGQVEWSVDGEDVVSAGPGDVVFVEQGKNYSISTVGDEPSIRITIAGPVI
ncbi:MAG: cupin domain-containing protein [Chloroflexi bacterium]|jgi:mannose-6-phosphate isomerase-like protein (cupin superfamily)|nr:cupin domain-containing protein [Chloroflexota bacterium]MBT5627929.1 cupin domain-containing protein [Chloroflexota bacterium]